MMEDASNSSGRFNAMFDNQEFAKVTSKIERVTGVYALHLLAQAGLGNYPKDVPLTVLESACRGGILTLQLQAMLKDRPQASFTIMCGDSAQAQVDVAQQRVEQEGWTNTTVLRIDAEDTKLPDEHFTHVFANFGVMTFANPHKALDEYSRVLQPGGVCGFTTWASIPWLDDMKAAMQSVPGLPELPSEMDIPNIFSTEKIWHDPDSIRRFVAQHMLVNVESNTVSITSVLNDVEELRTILKPPMTLMTKFFWTQEERDKLDNDATFEKIFAWFANKMSTQGPLEWNWSATVTTCSKPSREDR